MFGAQGGVLFQLEGWYNVVESRSKSHVIEAMNMFNSWGTVIKVNFKSTKNHKRSQRKDFAEGSGDQDLRILDVLYLFVIIINQEDKLQTATQ